MCNCLFKIENGILYQSKDNGCTWINLGNIVPIFTTLRTAADDGTELYILYNAQAEPILLTTIPDGQDGIDGLDGIDGIDGALGPLGPSGTNGLPLSMKLTEAECTNINDAYIDLVTGSSTKGHFKVRIATSGTNQWLDCGSIIGPKGDEGDGPEISLIEITGGYQIYVGDVLKGTIYNGITPNIGTNNNWWIGNIDTGILAKGTNGAQGIPGITPNITVNATVTTDSGATRCEVNKTGTDENPILSFIFYNIGNGGTINDAALSLKVNNNILTSFTANASTAKSFNIVQGNDILLTEDIDSSSVTVDKIDTSWISFLDDSMISSGNTRAMVITDKNNESVVFPGTFPYFQVLLEAKYNQNRNDKSKDIQCKLTTFVYADKKVDWKALIKTGTLTTAEYEAICELLNIVEKGTVKLDNGNPSIRYITECYRRVHCNQINKLIQDPNCFIQNGYLVIEDIFNLNSEDFMTFTDNTGHLQTNSCIELKF